MVYSNSGELLMAGDVDRLAKLHANLLLSIDNHTGESLWERNSLWTSSLKEVFDHAQKMWTELLGNLVRKSYRNRKEFSSDNRTRIENWMDELLDTDGKNANHFWLEFVNGNHELLDMILKENYSIDHSIRFYCSSEHVRIRNAAKYLYDDISGKINENKKLSLEKFSENPQFHLEKEFGTLVLFFHRIVETDSELDENIVLSYFEKVEWHHTNKDQLAESHRRKNVDRMLKQLEWQKYCGDPQRINKATDFLKINPVLTLIGIGGLGKTALATEIMRRKLASREFDHLTFITSKSGEQGQYTFSNTEKFSKEMESRHHPGDYADNFEVVINRLLEMDSTRNQTEKNMLTHDEKKNIVFQLFKEKKILCVLDNYEDIERNPEQRKKYSQLIDFLMTNETQSRIIITARETKSGVEFPVQHLNNNEIKNLLQERIKWHSNGNAAQEIANIQEYLSVIYQKIDQLQEKEFEIWGHPLIILYLAWMIFNKANQYDLVKKILEDEDEIVRDIAAYCVDKTLERLPEQLRQFVSYAIQEKESKFTRHDMADWYLEVKKKHLGTEQIEENIRQLKGGQNINSSIDQNDVQFFEIIPMTQTRFKHETENHEMTQLQQSTDQEVNLEKWINTLRDYVTDPLANPNFIKTQSDWVEKITQISNVNKKKKTELGYKNIIDAKVLINKLRNRSDLKLNPEVSIERDLLIPLMNYENLRTTRGIDIVNNILQLFSFSTMDNELKRQHSIEWLETWDKRHKENEAKINFNQESMQNIINALELIYEINFWNHESEINGARKIMRIWFNWFNYSFKQEFFTYLSDQDEVKWKASVVAYVLQKDSRDDLYEEWLTNSLKFLADNELKNHIRNVIHRHTYTSQELEKEISNNQAIMPYTQAFVRLDSQPFNNENNQLSCKLIFDRKDTDRKCILKINGFYVDDVIDYETEYLVKFENTELLSLINCTIARDENEDMITNNKSKNIIIKSNVKVVSDISSKKLARKVLRNLFLQKIESEGEIDSLCFQVSISQEITNSEYSFKDIKKAAGFGKKVAADIYVKELLGDKFMVVAAKKPRYLYFGEIDRKSPSTSLSSNKTHVNNPTSNDESNSAKLDPSKVKLPTKKEIHLLFDFIDWFADWIDSYIDQCEDNEFNSDRWFLMKKNILDSIDLSAPKRNSINLNLKRMVTNSLEKNDYSNLEKSKIISGFRELYTKRLNEHYRGRGLDVKKAVSSLFSNIK